MPTSTNDLASTINEAYEIIGKDPSVIQKPEIKDAINQALNLLDQGKIRVASPPDASPSEASDREKNKWQINTWVKKSILLYFRIKEMKIMRSGDIEYWDKIPLKTNFDKQNVRVVPPAVARYGSYIEPGAILMPSYVNIGAYVSSGSMVDTWATVGSCAQIGKSVHLSGGVGIGGVLEPPQASPVIIEDHAFLGSRAIVVEGVQIARGAVLGSGVILTSSTKIIDVTKKTNNVSQGVVPENTVVIPGSMPKEFEAGVYYVPCALIIGQRKESTDKKTSLNDALRDFQVSV